MEGSAPTTLLTQEQIDRIARNKAAALARLAKARGLAAWAAQPPRPVTQTLNEATPHLPHQRAHTFLASNWSKSPQGYEGSQGVGAETAECLSSKPEKPAGELDGDERRSDGTALSSECGAQPAYGLRPCTGLAKLPLGPPNGLAAQVASVETNTEGSLSMTDLEVDTMLGAEQPMSVGAAKTALEAFATAGLEARGVSERTGSLRAGGGSPTGGGMSDKGVSDTSNSMLRGKSGGASGQASPDAKKGAGKKGAFLRWPRQVFDYFLVIDFECTCDNVTTIEPQEIIEFPSVLLNARTLRIEDSFRVFCRPEVHSTLTPFCTRFTGIRQEQVDAGVSLREALQEHDTWLKSKNLLDKPNRFAVVTWTDWDCKVMLEMECKWKRIQKPAYFNQWVNLKHPFAKVFPKAKGTCHGLRGHVTYAGVTWEGREHSGLDDATNTARLAAAVIRQGSLLSITDSFKIYAADGSKIERVLKKRPLNQADSNARGKAPGKGSGERCHCGVKRRKRTVKKPGPTHGQAFYSCGKWTITGGGCCDYFEWMQDGVKEGVRGKDC